MSNLPPGLVGWKMPLAFFYDEDALDGTRTSEGLIAHEIVHQWFGNSATEKIGATFGSVKALLPILPMSILKKPKVCLHFAIDSKKNEKRLLPLRNATKVLSLIQPTIA